MSFAAPLFLLAALAGLIPLVLHLIHRQQAREVAFPSLRFLNLSVQKTRRRKYIEEILLLILRIAALLLIALGLAKPVISTWHGLLGRGSARAVVIVLDNSASMADLDAGRPRIETGRDAALAILDSLRPGDSAALVPTGGPPDPVYGVLTGSLDDLRAAVSRCPQSLTRARLPAALDQARRLLASSDAAASEIYLVSDHQAVSWNAEEQASTEDADPPAQGDLPIVAVALARSPALNLALAELRVETPAPVPGAPVQAAVAIRNPAPVAQQATLELRVGGEPRATSPTITVPPGKSVTQVFPFRLDDPGIHRGEIRLVEPDGNDLDNHAFFVLDVDPQVPVLVLKARRHEITYADEAFYLEQALAAGPAQEGPFRVTVHTPEELDAATLAAAAVVFAVDLPALGDATANLLRDFIRGGGHLVWIAGPNVDPAAYNAMNRQAQDDLLPAPLPEQPVPTTSAADSPTIAGIDADHPALHGLAQPPSLYQTVLVHRHVAQAAPATSDAHVLARLDTDEPLLTERKVGSGSILFLGTSTHVDWTNLPLKPIFLPLVVRLTLHLAGADSTRLLIASGAEVLLPAGAPGPADIEITRPSGSVERLRVEARDDGQIAFDQTHEPGVYLLKLINRQPERRLAFAINPDPAEADARYLDRPALTQRLGARDLVYCGDPATLTSTITRLREGTSLRDAFLALVLLALVLETALANRRGRQEAPRAAPVPSQARAQVVHLATGPPSADDSQVRDFLGQINQTAP